MKLDDILQNIPREVNWDDIPEFERMDDRVCMVSMICSNIIGVNEGYIEWCPNEEPPIESETLAWIWVIRPDLGEEIQARANEDLRQTILDYIQTDGFSKDVNEIPKALNDLIQVFIEASLAQYQATMSGDFKICNKNAKLQAKIFEKIKKHYGDEGRKAIATLMEDQNLIIKSAAAVYSMRFDVERAKKTLQELTNDTGLIGFEATEALKRWEEGNWDFD